MSEGITKYKSEIANIDEPFEGVLYGGSVDNLTDHDGIDDGYIGSVFYKVDKVSIGLKVINDYVALMSEKISIFSGFDYSLDYISSIDLEGYYIADFQKAFYDKTY